MPAAARAPVDIVVRCAFEGPAAKYFELVDEFGGVEEEVELSAGEARRNIHSAGLLALEFGSTILISTSLPGVVHLAGELL